MLRLVKTNTKYKESFLDALRDDHKEKRNIDLNVKILQKQKNFSAFVRNLHNHEKGIDLPKKLVPCTTFWLINGNKFIGRVSVRHRMPIIKESGHIGYEIRVSERKKGYGNKILAMVLPKAYRLGLKKVLIICNEDNIGSRKIIENNGGILKNKFTGNSGKIRLRYWINIQKVLKIR
jgi:predicted acetyltransferase